MKYIDPDRYNAHTPNTQYKRECEYKMLQLICNLQ